MQTFFDAVPVAIAIGSVLWAVFRFAREGPYRARIEFSIGCNFKGLVGESHLTEFQLIFRNKGQLRVKLPSIRLRVRGIPGNASSLEYWPGREPRLSFPDQLFEAEVVYHERYKHLFVEPNVEQTVTYVTKIPARFRFLAARASFRYDNWRSHSAERVFEVPGAKVDSRPGLDAAK